MPYTYTPGLKVVRETVVHKRRILPIPGRVLVEKGQGVESSTVVAKTDLPGSVHTVNVANLLGITPDEIRDYMLRREGEDVPAGGPLAENRPLIRWFKTQVKSPITGVVENVSTVTGQVLLREPPRPLELKAYIDGWVEEIMPEQGVTLMTVCAFIQGIFGIGPEATGRLSLVVGGPEEVLSKDRLTEQHRGRILIGGGFASWDALERAREIGIAGLVVGGIDDLDLKRLLGYDLGVAVTGTEQVGFTLILTEGFGHIPMAGKTFELLAAHVDKKASISGATQIRAGVMRPEVIIPIRANLTHEAGPLPQVEGVSEDQSASGGEGLKIGDSVRVIREPYFGSIGRVKALPAELVVIPTESKVRAVQVVLQSGQTLIIPRANVERIEG